IRHPHHRNAEDDDIGHEVRDPRAQPPGLRFLAVPDPGRPARAHGHAGGEVVGDGTDQEPADGREGGELDPETVAAAGAGDEDAAVEDDEGEFQEAEGGGPGDFFDEEGLI
ncbi:MAG: hypothetical protein LQ352_007913, partial [Teloschistes flavicans]